MLYIRLFEYDGRRRFQLPESGKYFCSDNNACKAHNDGAGADGDFKESLSAGSIRHPRGRQGPFARARPRILERSLCPSRGSDKGFVVSNGPQQISGTRFHIQIEEYFDCRHDQKKNHNGAEFIQGREPYTNSLSKDRIPAENRQICLIARDSKFREYRAVTTIIPEEEGRAPSI